MQQDTTTAADGGGGSDDAGLEDRVRLRIRSLRTSRGWSLDELARRSLVNASTISRLETGGRRIALDQLVPLARALGVTIDELLDAPEDDEVVIRPRKDVIQGMTVWPLTRQRDGSDLVVNKMRVPADRGEPDPRVHPGWDWVYVLDGTLLLVLGERRLLVEAGQAAQFSTMTPHWFAGHGGPVEILGIFDRHGERSHLHPGPA